MNKCDHKKAMLDKADMFIKRAKKYSEFAQILVDILDKRISDDQIRSKANEYLDKSGILVSGARELIEECKK